MQRYTKESVKVAADMWDQLDEDVSASDFVKLATVAIQEAPVWTGPRAPAGCLLKIASERVDAPIYPGDDAPEWRMREYQGEVKEAMLKLAGFWERAFRNIASTVKNVVSGGASTPPPSVKNVLRTVPYDRAADGRAAFKLEDLASALKKMQKADPLEGKYRMGQMGLAVAIPAAAVAAGSKAWSAASRRRQYGRIEHAIAQDPEFENQADKEEAISESYGLMRKYAPSIALDPVISKAFVKAMVALPDMQNIDTVQNLMEAEKKFQDSTQFSTDLRDIQKLTRHPLVAPFAGGGGK